jgi:hypothetical protein
MDPSTAPLRDQALQAMREGQIDKAIDLLARAVMRDDSDAEAKALLGVAYSQKGLHEQAKRALQTAVELQPQNPSFKFNLGMVLERAGDTPGAAVAFWETLQLNKDHAQAKARLQAMGPAAHTYIAKAPKPHEPVGVPTYNATEDPLGPPSYTTQPYNPGPAGPAPNPFSPPPPAAPAGGPPAATQYGGPPQYSGPPAAPLGGPPPGQYGGPPAVGGPLVGGAPGHGGPPGTVQCPTCHQFSRPGLSCEFCAGALQAPRHPAVAMPPPGAPVGGSLAGAYYQDSFDLVQAVKDWWGALTSPRVFFSEQAGREGLLAPMAYLLVATVITYIPVLVFYGIMGLFNPLMLVGGVCGIACGYLGVLAVSFIWGGIVHGVTRLLGGQGSYSATFRAVTYANAPGLACNLLSMIVMMAMMGGLVASIVGSARGTGVSALPQPIRVAQANPPGAPFGQTPGFPGGAGQPGGPGMGGPFGSSSSTPTPQLSPEQLAQMVAAMIIPSLISFIGGIWSLVLLGMGLAHVHSMSGGAAAGSVVLSVVVVIVIYVVLYFLMFAGLMAAVLSGAGGASPGGGGGPPGTSPFPAR